jgi:hypothetical protein
MVVEVTQLEEPPVLHSENIEQHEKETESETLLEAEIIVNRRFFQLCHLNHHVTIMSLLCILSIVTFGIIFILHVFVCIYRGGS